VLCFTRQSDMQLERGQLGNLAHRLFNVRALFLSFANKSLILKQKETKLVQTHSPARVLDRLVM